MIHSSVFLVLFYFIPIASSVHFLGGTITWRPMNQTATGSPVALLITQTYYWTYSYVTCTYNMSLSHDLIIFQPSYTPLETTLLVCIANCPTSSLGYSAPFIRPYCMNISIPLNTIFGARSDIVNLTSGDDFTVAFQSGNWRPLKSHGSAPWSIASNIKLIPRSDNGLYNSAPSAILESPIYIPVNYTVAIYIQVSDPDGDIFRCRWSTSTPIDECGQACPPSSLPQNTTIHPNCTIIITGETIGDWHAVTVTVEDFINSTSTNPLSSAPIQFLVNVVEHNITTTTTTTTTITTTTTTERLKESSIEFPLTLTIAILSVLGVLVLLCCLCYCCFRLCYAAVLKTDPIGRKPTLYHIEHCMNSDCHWNDRSIPKTGNNSHDRKKQVVVKRISRYQSEKELSHNLILNQRGASCFHDASALYRSKHFYPGQSIYPKPTFPLRVRRLYSAATFNRSTIDDNPSISVIENTIQLNRNNHLC